MMRVFQVAFFPSVVMTLLMVAQVEGFIQIFPQWFIWPALGVMFVYVVIYLRMVRAEIRRLTSASR